MNWRHVVVPALAVALTGCQPGTSGPLIPVQTASVIVIPADEGAPTASVNHAFVTADVTGSWWSEGAVNLVVVYSNISDDAASIVPSRFAMRRGGDRLELSSIVHSPGPATESDLVNDPPPPLFNALTTPMVASLDVPAGESRSIEISFDVVPRGSDSIGPDQSFEFDAVLPTRIAPIAFRSGEWGQ